MIEKEDKTLGFIPENTECDFCYELGATHFDGQSFFCEDCWPEPKVIEE